MTLKNFARKMVEKHRFSISELVKNNKIRKKGVLHVGANFGQEADVYDQLGFQNIVWVEGYPKFANKLRENVRHRKGHRVIEAMLSEVSGEEVVFSITSNTGSSTLFEPTDGWHKTFSEISIVDKEKIVCRRLDEVLSESLTDKELESLNFLVLDVEGAELKVLNSMGAAIKSIEWALIEVSFRNNFEGGPLLQDIDSFMLNNSFVRVYLKCGAASGDGLYRKVGKVSIWEVVKARATCFLIQNLSATHITDVVVMLKKQIKLMLSLKP